MKKAVVFIKIILLVLVLFINIQAQDRLEEIDEKPSRKIHYLSADWLKQGELLQHKERKKVFHADSYEGVGLQVVHQLEGLWNPLAFRVGLEYPLKGKLIYKYKKDETLKQVKKQFYVNRFNFAYYYHKDLHHALRFFFDFGKSWSYPSSFFMESGAIWGYMLNILPAPAYEISEDLTTIKTHKHPLTHHINLGGYFSLGKEIYTEHQKIRIFFRTNLYLSSYNIGFVPLYDVEWGASVLLFKKKNIRKNEKI